MNTQPPIVLEQLLAERHWLRTLAHSLVRDPHLASDLEQETWRTAVERPPSHARSPRAWLGTVLRHRARDQHRSTTRRVARETRVARPEAQRSAGELAQQADTQRRVISAVLSLDDPYRNTVLLRYFEDLDATAIAKRMDTTPSTVRTRLTRALAKLRDALKEEFGDGFSWHAALVPFLPMKEHSAKSTLHEAAIETSSMAPRFPRSAFLTTALAALLLGGALLWWAPWKSDEPLNPVTSLDVVSADHAVAPRTGPLLEGADTTSAPAPPMTSGSESSSVPVTTDDVPSEIEKGARTPAYKTRLVVLVVDDQQRPVEGADVLLIDRSDAKHPMKGMLVARTKSDVEGRATFERFPPKGNLHVRAAFRDAAAITNEFDGMEPPKEPIRAVLGDTRVVAGRVINEDGHAVPHAAVLVHARFGQAIVAIAMTRTDESGVFSMAGIPSSRLRVGQVRPADVEVRAKGYGEVWHTLKNRDEDLAALTLTLSKSRSITGRVVNERGIPVADVSLEFPDSVGGTSTNAKGRFQAGRLPQRTIKVLFRSSEHAPTLIDVPFTGEFNLALDDVVLRPGDAIAGVVVDKNGDLLAGALVALASDAGDQIVRQGESDDQGRFEFKHFGAGQHEVHVFTRSGKKANRKGVHAGDLDVRIVVGD